MIKQSSISQIMDGLWIGAFPSVEVASHFDKLILCASDCEPLLHVYDPDHILNVPLSSSCTSAKDAQVAVQAGRAVAGWLRRGSTVLVACGTGLNRSALVASVALMTRGMSSAQAVDRVKGARGNLVMLSPHFGLLLRRLEDAREFHLSSAGL